MGEKKRKRVTGEESEKKRMKGEGKGEEEEEGSESEKRDCEMCGESEGFQCSICLEMMRWEREPRSLPCGHSFCSDCLNKLFFSQQSPTLKSAPNVPSSLPLLPSSSSSSSSCLDDPTKKRRCCPVCRKEIEREGGCETIESLASNCLIPETIDVIESLKIPSLCRALHTSCFFFLSPFLFYLYLKGLFPKLQFNITQYPTNQTRGTDVTRECANFGKCGERTSMYCSDCKVFICDSCEQSHSSNAFTRNHKRENQQQQEEEERNQQHENDEGLESLKKKHCSTHPSEYLSGFCFECSLFVCVSCVLGVHDEHRQNVCSLEESVLRKRNEILKIGVGLEKRLEFVEKKTRTVEQEIKELEEKLENKKVMKKDLDLEKVDLRMRCDTILRLSQTPTTDSIFDEDLFSAFLQIANNLIGKIDVSVSNEKGMIGDRIHFVSSFRCDEKPWGIVENIDGNFIVGHNGGKLDIRNKEGSLIQTLTFDGAFIDVAIGLNDEIVAFNQVKSEVMVLNKEGHLIRSFGSEGSEPGLFNKPCGIDIDEEGRIIVADSQNHRIQVFSYDGSFIRCFGTKGSSEGQFNHPCCVVVDGDGNLVISDCWNNRIQVMGIEGNFIRTFGEKGSNDSQLEGPTGVDVDRNGRIIVVEWGNGRVSVFEKDGTFLFSFGSGQMKKPNRAIIHSSGSILISEPQTLQLWK